MEESRLLAEAERRQELERREQELHALQEREQRRMEREEQDRAYEQSLMMDRVKKAEQVMKL